MTTAQLCNRYQAGIFLLLYVLCHSCAPKVFSFQASPCTTITREDSLRFTWRVRGTPTLLFYTEDADDDENPGKQYFFYKLVAQKKGKEAVFPTLGITLLRDTAIDNIYINTTRSGDSAVAIGNKDSAAWGTHFLLESVVSLSHRSLTVIHGGKTIELDADGHSSAGLKGLCNSGPWTIRTLLSAAEKKDTTLIPGRLQVKTIVIYSKN